MTEVSTRDDAVARAERIRSGIRALAELQQDITEAYHARDWQTLGYDTWDEYVSEEFGHALPKLDRTERRELVVNLRAEGLSTRAIASATGTSKSQVAEDARVQNWTPEVDEPESAPVTGLDGKTYAPKSPPITPEEIADLVPPPQNPVRSARPDMVSDDELAELNGATPVPSAPGPVQPERRERTDVVKTINQALVRAEEAAERADHIRKEHLSHRSEEAAVWHRRLSAALDQLQRLNTSLQEATS